MPGRTCRPSPKADERAVHQNLIVDGGRIIGDGNQLPQLALAGAPPPAAIRRNM
jgi:hypothetical protein